MTNTGVWTELGRNRLLAPDAQAAMASLVCFALHLGLLRYVYRFDD